MRFQCTFCQFINNVDDQLKGQITVCPSCQNTLRIPSDISESMLIGDFVILSKIGQGSIGTVYKAKQISLGRLVALKILSHEYTNAKGATAFLSEARAAAKLNHPNLVQSFAVGEDNGICYMAMTLLSGITVKNRIKQDKQIPIDEALHIVQQVAEALHYAWTEAKIIHRDVKPENIMISEEGIVKLTDLGLAMQEKDWREGMEISGSPSYMSPEQFSGEKLDTRSDIYSLGVSLYQMLSGKLPFNADTLTSVARQHFHEEPMPLNKLDSAIPQVVSALVRKMMAKHPNERFQTMEDLLLQIWKIRQKTAPNKNLIPSVHTISIKRLDYEKQVQNNKNKKNNSDYQNYHRHSSNISSSPIVPYILGLIIIILGGVIGFLLFLRPPVKEQTNNREKALQNRIEIFQTAASEKNVDPEYIREQAMILLNEIDISPSISPNYKYAIFLEMERLSRQEEQKRKLAVESQVEKLSGIIKTQEDSIKKLKALSLNNQSLKESGVTDAQLQIVQNDLSHTKAQLALLRDENASIKLESEKKSVRYTELEKQYYANRHTYFFKYFYALFRLSQYSDCIILSENELNRCTDEKEREYLKRYVDFANKSQAAATALTQGDKAILGKTIRINDNLVSIISLDNGSLTYKNELKAILSIKIEELPVNDVANLLKIIFPNETEDHLKVLILLLRNNYSDSLLIMKDNVFLYDFVVAAIKEQMILLKSMPKNDQKRIQARAKLILKMIGESDKFQEQRTEILQFLKEQNIVLPSSTSPVGDP